MNIIWDMDGTLANSYEAIVESLFIIEQKAGLNYSRDEILKIIKKGTVGDFRRILLSEGTITSEEYSNMYYSLEFELIPKVVAEVGAIETLEKLKEKGYRHFVFTHRDRTTNIILETNDMGKYFDEVVTAENHFKFKPDPEANLYLIEKYNLNKDETYYVGDRQLDILSGYNAGIKTILYKPEDSVVEPTGKEDYIVDSLLKIVDILDATK